MTHFVGTAGENYVAYGLAVRGLHASLTNGNAPLLDILAANGAGTRHLSIQVKTSRNARRNNRYGREGYEWDVGAAAVGKKHKNLWYFFVDLRENNGNSWNPEVFVVPSFWVGDFVKSDFSRKLYFLPSTAKGETSERWDLVADYLSEDQQRIDDATRWATTWRDDLLVRWGEENYAEQARKTTAPCTHETA